MATSHEKVLLIGWISQDIYSNPKNPINIPNTPNQHPKLRKEQSQELYNNLPCPHDDVKYVHANFQPLYHHTWKTPTAHLAALISCLVHIKRGPYEMYVAYNIEQIKYIHPRPCKANPYPLETCVVVANDYYYYVPSLSSFPAFRKYSMGLIGTEENVSKPFSTRTYL